MNRTGRILAGLAALFAAGFVTGVLYAPDKGERTRRRIVRNGGKMYNTVNDTVAEGRDTLEELRDRLKENIETVNGELDRLSKC